MREIKFRAMSEMGNWVYFSIWGINPPLNKNKFKNLCQYTGLEDKNSVEIYEGHVVNTNWGKFIIKFSEKYLCFIFEKIEFLRLPERNNDLPISYHSEFEFIEIIGNRFENPELVEGK